MIPAKFLWPETTVMKLRTRKKPFVAAAVRIPWDPTKHPRHPAGSPAGGEFAPSYYGVRFARENNDEHAPVIGYVGYHMQPGRMRTDFVTTDVGPVRATYQEALKDAHAAADAEKAAPGLGEKWSRGTNITGLTEHRNGPYAIVGRKVSAATHPYTTAYAVTREGRSVGIASSLDKAKQMAARDVDGSTPSPEEIVSTIESKKYHWHELYGGNPAVMSEERYDRARAGLQAAYDSIDPARDRVTGYRNQIGSTMRSGALERQKALAAAASEAQLERTRTRARGRVGFGRTPWDETKHPRHPAGTEVGGEFRPKGILVDWGKARAEFEKWKADMAQWYTEKEGFPPDYFPAQAAETWRQYEASVNAELVPLRARLDEAGVSGVTIQPQLSSAAGGDLDAIMDPESVHTPDFDISMRADPEAHPSDRPGFSLWTFPPPDEDMVEDIIPLDDTSYFPQGPESDTAAGYVRLLDAAANRPSSPEPVRMYRGMSDAEIQAWESGAEIPAGKFFTSRPTTAYAQDISGEPPVLQQYQIPRDMLVEVGPGEFQLKKRARMKAGKFEAVTGAGWAEEKHPRHPRGSERGGEFRSKSAVAVGPVMDESVSPEMDAAFEETLRMMGLHREAERRAAAEAAGTFVRHSDDTVLPDERVHDFTDEYLNELADEIEFEREDGDPNGIADSMDEELARAATFQQNARSAFEPISQVHSIPASADEVELTLNPSLGNDTWGEHYAETYVPPEAALKPQMRSRYIRLNPMKDPEMAAGTMTHEFGHYMDVQIGDGSGWYSDSPDGAGIRDAIANSEAVKTLKRYHEQDPLYVDYLLGNQESFARAYAQWVALRSGDEGLMRSVREPGDMAGLPERQWDDVDFGPIAAEFDKAFDRWRE